MINGGRTRAGTIAGLALVAVLGIGCVITYRQLSDGLPDLNYQSLSAVGEEGRMARDGLALADFGDSDGYGYVRDFEQIVDMKFLSAKEIAVIEAGTATAARATVAKSPQGRVVAIVVKLASPEVAQDVAAELDQLQIEAGMRRVLAPPSVHRAEIAGATPDGRVHYAHDRLLVRVDLAAAPGVPLGPAFTGVINRQLKELSADG
ncbi:hypothetical protein [Amycolatopsis benzoatilytica]|uniref:hypothetical protein n=1 Tax=Amycolatopsis benzoatilytica TaxID=346045 RepID=UPI00035CA5D1|nr:hypothetical protein [Amycolatopsis benzoatilytica]